MPAYLIMCCQKVLLYSYIMLTFWSFCSAPRFLAVFFVVVVAVFIFVPAALLLIPLPVPIQGASTVS